MSLLFKNLRIHQVFGANTEVGKTILTSGLVRASAAKKNKVFYLKPVSTGPIQHADDEHVRRYAGPHKDLETAQCLYRFDESVSPHLTASMAAENKGAHCVVVPTDDSDEFVTSVACYIRKCASGITERSHMYIETAGGVYSPTLSGTTQLDSYRPLFLPSILVRDSRLGGGISSTISAYESLLLRGYIVDSILLFKDKYYCNWEYLGPYFAKHGVKPACDTGLLGVVEHLDERHEARIRELHSMARRTLDTVSLSVMGVRAGIPFAATVRWLCFMVDSSPWTRSPCAHAGRYGHVMYPQATHAPALRLAERLIHDGPGKGWASRAFISDNGSTGMEIALKMALWVANKRFGLAPQERKKMGVLGLRGIYHGDTIGSMDACEEGNGRAIINLPPAVMHENVEGEPLSWIYNVGARLDTPLAAAYRTHINVTLQKLASSGAPPFGALVLEPLVLGASGMIFVAPLFQRVLIDAVRAHGLPVVFDEVFAGLWHLGVPSAVPLLGTFPDVSVHAKILTGGLVSLAVTLASDNVFRLFEGTSKAEALLHWHSYTAYAVGCEVANETLDQLERIACGETWKAARGAWQQADGEKGCDEIDEDKGVRGMWLPKFVDTLSKLDVIDQVMTLGTVLALKVRGNDTGYQPHSAQALLSALGDATGEAGRNVTSAPGGARFSINFRTLGDVAYLMMSLNTPPATITVGPGCLVSTIRISSLRVHAHHRHQVDPGSGILC
ncbi:pyridoxal phosphate-dependent transferase [Lactifluus subvellereus]|nr:pyridoxal phosphate-dependent transferase [Lactifluus subvellereus]